MTPSLRLVHVAEVALSASTGMGRVAVHWQQEAERRGFEFVHIGPDEVGPLRHPGLFPRAARRVYRAMHGQADCLLVHEPASGAFVNESTPMVVVSHGIERRVWEMQRAGDLGASQVPTLRTQIAFPLWRLRTADRGLRRGTRVFVLNQQDAEFVERHYRRHPDDIYVFSNGVEPTTVTADDTPEDGFTVLFVGSWIERKGTATLLTTAASLAAQGLSVRWLLAGTGVDATTIRSQFPQSPNVTVEVIPSFPPEQEADLLRQAHAYVLPSFFEGQPLALLQAMAAGRCCVTTDCCGQRDLITHDDNGLLFEPGSASALTELLTRCHHDPALRLRLGSAARRSVETRTWARTSAEVMDRISAVANH